MKRVFKLLLTMLLLVSMGFVKLQTMSAKSVDYCEMNQMAFEQSAGKSKCEYRGWFRRCTAECDETEGRAECTRKGCMCT